MAGARELKAVDIMTADLVSVGRDARAADIAEIVIWRRVSPVPVVERGIVVGMVGEADLLRVLASGARRKRRPWWMRLLPGASVPIALAEFRALRAADLMGPPAPVVAPETPLAALARIFERPGIRRVPVLRDGRLAGVVTRAALAQALPAKAAAWAGDRAADAESRRRALRRPRLSPCEFTTTE
jgi:CBS domain-containing protein